MPDPAAHPSPGGHLLLRERAYESLVRVAAPVARVVAPLHPKLRRGLEGRVGLVGRLEAWARDGRDHARPLVWVHAPSLGEGLMAQAIVAALRRARPDAQVLFTHFSPSAARLRGRIAADAFDYLPWDARPFLRPALAAVRPALLALVRTDVWPVLTAEATRAGAAVALVNAVLGPRSGRAGAAARLLLRPAHRRLARVGAVSEDDARRFPRLGVPPERVRVTGDARFDQAAERVAAMDRGTSVLGRLRAGPPVLVAGSTWEADEARLIPAVAPLLATRRLRLVVAPHEPTPSHLEALERRLAGARLTAARLGAWEASSAQAPAVLVVDRVGVLAELYAAATMAYVGGGFHAGGLHSVVEPAALGVPVIFGPRAGNTREAAALAEEGGGERVAREGALARAVERLLEDGGAREAAGAAAAAFVERRRGGAAANAALLAELLDP